MENKKENAENIFGECLRLAWTEAKAKTPKKVGERKISRRIAYRVFKNIENLADGVNMKKCAYHKEGKTIDVILTFDERFFLMDSWSGKVNGELLNRFNSTSDENIVFSCEVKEMAEKAGVTSKFVLKNSCDMEADGWIEEKKNEEAKRGNENYVNEYAKMQEMRKNIFCIEAIN